jgi:class 3 adenylate cyclase/tetratricopeptide (TPR) repeat protein
MDVGEWLRGLGLGEYEERFRENRIDADVLPRLTAHDLKDIGVSAVGDRRRLLDAIAALAEATSAAEFPGSQSRSAPARGRPQATAERRPITVMFCDLVGSTGLAARLDAEDWRDLVSAYLDQASEAVAGFGGHVLRRLGDGLMALFGYPQAQENDAERAVRAALAIQRALGELNARNAVKGAPELSARIGLAVGPVVVDAAGEVFGDTPNIAARVQAAAEPGSVLVTANIQRQVAGLFVAEEQGAQNLKGAPLPVSLYRMVRASGGVWGGGARTLTPLIGREEEIDLLMRSWERARAGDGQLVLIVGEPGIGKSRLLEEFHKRLGETPHTWSIWSASQLLQNTPLHPIAEWGRFRFGGQLPAEQRLADLEGTLRLLGLDETKYAPLLAPLVDIPLPPGRDASFPPEEMRRRQLTAMVAWALAGARSQPLALAFEDLQWADPTSLELMRALAERGAQAPLLLVVTVRPEFHPPWSQRSHHSVIALSQLDRAQVARMIGMLASHHMLSREIVEGVSDRTGGVPLFVEEVTRLLLERGVEVGAQAIPPTLQQSLAARLDRLGAAREVAQIGAMLGRDFTHALLRDVSGAGNGVARDGEDGQPSADDAGLASALERLVEADILLVNGAGPQANYRFKHALIQDAAYDSLLKSRRQALHRRAAEVLRDQPDRAAAEPEVIAHHFTEAGLDDLAIEWWGKAGDQALRRSASQEAVAHLGKALALADKPGGGKSADVATRRVQLHVAYANALIAARGHGAPETAEAFARARGSASGDEDAPARLAADYGLWAGCYVRGELSPMKTHAAACLADIEERPDSPEASVAHRVAGTTLWVAGEFEQARNHLERALALFQPGRDDDLAFRFGQDAGVAAMADLAHALWPAGDVDRATSLMERLEARIAEVAHAGTIAFGRFHLAAFELRGGDRSRVAPHALELARITREHDLPLFRSFSLFLEGLTTLDSAAPGGGLEGMRRGAELLRERNIAPFNGLLKIALAEAEFVAGDPDRAIAVIDEALLVCGATGYCAFEAELRRKRGEMLLRRDAANRDAAEAEFRMAIDVARRQRAQSFVLRAALSLAKLNQSLNRPDNARAVLAAALEGFSPTPRMPEVVEAQSLLARLG